MRKTSRDERLEPATQNSRSSREILKMEMTRRQAALLLAEAMVGVPMAARRQRFGRRNCVAAGDKPAGTRRRAGSARLYRALV